MCKCLPPVAINDPEKYKGEEKACRDYKNIIGYTKGFDVGSNETFLVQVSHNYGSSVENKMKDNRYPQ